MRYYRLPETGELIRFSLEANAWSEMRCDASTNYEVKWLPLRMNADLARATTPVTSAVAEAEVISTRKANSAARGEAFLNRMRSTGMGF